MESAPDTDKRQVPLLAAENLTVAFPNAASGDRPVVDQLSLTVDAGEKIAIVGATGSGKSLLLLSLLGLLPSQARIRGRIRIAGEDIEAMDAVRLCVHRGVTAAYVPQGSGGALNPVLGVSGQVAERLQVHRGMGREEAHRLAAEKLMAVGLPAAARNLRTYPHQLSGGMRQRALMAMALAGDPRLILADEPTKGLDPETRDGIVSLFREFAGEGLLVVTHDLDVARALEGSIIVMLDGMVMETAPVSLLFKSPLHPYTRALIAAQPSLGMHVEHSAYASAGPDKTDGCPYRRLCPEAMARCDRRPPLETVGNRQVRCWQHAD